MLMDEIRRHECGMVISGYGWPNGVSTEQVKVFLRNDLHYGSRADTQVIRSVSTLSRGRGPSPRMSVLVMFGSIIERNECLRQSYHLAKGISIDKFVPKRTGMETEDHFRSQYLDRI